MRVDAMYILKMILIILAIVLIILLILGKVSL